MCCFMHSRRGIGVATTALVGIVAVLATAVFFLYPGSNFWLSPALRKLYALGYDNGYLNAIPRTK